VSTHYVITLKVTKVDKPESGNAPRQGAEYRPSTMQPPVSREIEEVTQFTATRPSLSSAVRLVTGHLDLLVEDGES